MGWCIRGTLARAVPRPAQGKTSCLAMPRIHLPAPTRNVGACLSHDPSLRPELFRTACVNQSGTRLNGRTTSGGVRDERNPQGSCAGDSRVVAIDAGSRERNQALQPGFTGRRGRTACVGFAGRFPGLLPEFTDPGTPASPGAWRVRRSRRLAAGIAGYWFDLPTGGRGYLRGRGGSHVRRRCWRCACRVDVFLRI